VVAGSIPAGRSDPFVAQMVEHAVLSTLVADLFRSECRWNYMDSYVAGSNPAASFRRRVAQSVEQRMFRRPLVAAYFVRTGSDSDWALAFEQVEPDRFRSRF